MKHASPAPPPYPGGGRQLCAFFFFFEISANILWQLMEVDALRQNLWSVRVGRGEQGLQGGAGDGSEGGVDWPGPGHGSLAQSWNKQ